MIFFIFSLTASTFSQTVDYKFQKTGQPFLQYFSPKVYKSALSNWCIVQDTRGVMYFGNETGILEFDGVSWRKIEVPYNSAVRSMALADDGMIYVCASSDFGYLAPDSSGKLKYNSLMGYLAKKYRNYGEMWDVIASSKAVYFKTKDNIFRWQDKKITVWDSVNAFRLYNINDKIYSRNQGIGLMVIDGDSIVVMPDGKYFADTGVFDMLPFDDKSSTGGERILVTTNTSGLFLSDGEKFSPFRTDDDAFLKASQIYNSCITSDGNFAFATQRGGVIIMDHKGHFINIIDENSGLPTNVIYDVYSGRHGGLWLATNNGIVYCEIPSPFSILPSKGTAKYPLYSMLRFNDKLYIANELGIIFSNKGQSSFKLVQGINKPGYDLIKYDGSIIAATNSGVQLIKDDKLQETLDQPSAVTIVPSKYYPGRLYSANSGGLTILTKINVNDFDVHTTNIDEEIVSVVEDKDSSLWINSLDGGIIHVTGGIKHLLSGQIIKIDYNRYRKETIPGYLTQFYDINNKALLSTNKGLFRFDKYANKFVPDSTLGSVFADSANKILNITTGTNSDLWILADINGVNELGKAKLQENGNYIWQPDPVFKRLDLSSITAIYAEPDPAANGDVLWISTDEGLVHYSSVHRKDIRSDYECLVRKVEVKNDSLIYGGANISGSKMNKLILPFSDNNISFSVSAVSFDKPGANLYQYLLEGNNNKWSQWTAESKKEFTNLAGGDYTLRVRAKNIYGVVSSEATFSFSVLPPWYLSWWAFVIYSVLILTGIYFTDRIMRARITKKERDKAKLREAELIKKQAEELETVDKLVRVINNAEDIDTLFNSLLVQTVSFIPKAEKAAVFLLDHNDNKFHVAFTLGYNIDALKSIPFSSGDLKRRYTENSEEIEKGIYIISSTEKLHGNEMFSRINKASSMLVMAVEWENKLEAYVVFDSFADKNSFDPSTARILNRFREHAVSAILKAQSIKILQEKNEEIIKTQEQLVTQQKLASLGALTAGIAHEIKNPLNFVNNFSEISSELLDEVTEELQNNNKEEVLSIINDLRQNLDKIRQHGKRADSIVKGMLLHSRGTTGEKTPTDLNDLLDQYVTLAYHGMRAQNKEFNITIEKDYDRTLGKINVVPQDISRVFLNIINNACYAAYDKKKTSGNDFSPILKVSTKKIKGKVEIRICDNGEGIPESVKKQIFNPFFTTKPSGEGTGLGLSLSYDIITKVHGGNIIVESEYGKGAGFIIQLPLT